MTRTDVHRPSALVPEDYSAVIDFYQPDPAEVIGAVLAGFDPQKLGNRQEAQEIYLAEGVRIHGGLFNCDVCGAWYKYGTLFRHKSGEVISMGHQCADKLEFFRDQGAGEAFRKEARNFALLARERAERRERVFTWGRENRELLAALRTKHPIVQEMRSRLVQTHARWGLSDKQIELVRKLHAESLVPKEEEATVQAAIVEGKRQTVEGKIVSCKWHDSDYGGSFKITVKVETPDGVWLCWGSLPSSIDDALHKEHEAAYSAWQDHLCEAQKRGLGYHDAAEAVGEAPKSDFAPRLRGRTIRFDARLKPGRDEHFALFSRPTKAVLEDLD